MSPKKSKASSKTPRRVHRKLDSGVLNPGDTWTCECGTKHDLGGYVAAHWTEELIHTCCACQRKHSVCKGYLELIENKGSSFSGPASGTE